MEELLGRLKDMSGDYCLEEEKDLRKQNNFILSQFLLHSFFQHFDSIKHTFILIYIYFQNLIFLY